MRQLLARFIFLLVMVLCVPTFAVMAAITPEQRAKVQELVEMTREAGELYSGGKFLDSAAKVSEIQSQLMELMQSKDAGLQRLVRPLYTRLSRAHGLLELEGAELQPLPSWEDLINVEVMDAEAGMAAGVSFKEQVAPWLISACGNCHITNRRGNFSLASYNDLMRGPPEGTVIFAGSETGNRVVEVIESGDMPRGGGRVAPEQLANLKRWIAEGAKFDGPDPTAPLASLVEGAAATPAAATPMQVQAATGSETVSFSRDIAPILKDNCNGCHIAGRQASGNFRMDSLAQLLRGGDSGAVIADRAPGDSLLVQKLEGTAGLRMPAGGRPPLAAAQIELISTWIREGAAFDGPAASTNIDVVINQAWASKASHAELFQRRQQNAQASWTRVLPKDQPTSAQDEQFFVLGNIPPRRLEQILGQFVSATALIKKQLDAPEGEPLIKGGLTVFVLKSRYDYSEFGRMTESRELPKGWLGHWYADALQAYGVLVGDAEIAEEQTQAVAVQIATGAYLGSFPGVPTWFAEGVARNLVSNNHRRDDPRVKQWQASLPAANRQIDDAKTLLEGRLDEEAAGVVGMALTQFMMERTNRRRFDKLLSLLREGKTFDEAVTATYAPPETLVKTWIGK